MARPLRVVIRVFLLISLIYSVGFIRSNVVFERFLNSLFITFNDFPPDYTQALVLSASHNNTPLVYNYSMYPILDPTVIIPETIHFIWFRDLYDVKPNGTEIPSTGSNTPDLCRKYNPDFTINVWNASSARNLLEQHYDWFLPTYDGYKHPIQRVDAFKYFVLWHYGGVYMDMDVSCRRSLVPLLQFPAWFPRASPLGVNNDLMASRARHPVVGKMIESLERRDRNLIFPYLTIFWSTGPRFTTDTLNRWLGKHAGEPYVKGSSKALSGKSQLWWRYETIRRAVLTNS